METAKIESPVNVTLGNERKKEKRIKSSDATNLDHVADVASVTKERKKKTKSSDDGESENVGNKRALLVSKNVGCTNLEPAVNVTSGMEGKKKQNKRSDNAEIATLDKDCTLLASEQVEETSLEPAVDVTLGKKEKKKKLKSSDVVEITTVVKDSALFEPIKVEATRLEPAADVTSGKKKGKKKNRRSSDVEMTTADDVGGTLSVPNKLEDTCLEPVVDVTLGKKDEKKKPERSNVVEMTTVVKDSALSDPTKMEATSVEPAADVTSGKKKRNKKTQRSEDVEMETVDDASTLLVLTKAEDTCLVPAADVTSGKDRKKKSKRSNDLEVKTVDNESTLLVSGKVEDTSLESAADVTSGKKKKKKKAKRSGDDETTVDNENTLLVTVNAEETMLEPATDGTLGKAGTKKETKRSSDLEMETVDHDSIRILPTKEDTRNLDPAVDVTSGKKKRKKKIDSSGNVETTIVDNKRSEDVEMASVDDTSTLLVPTKAEDTCLVPAADVTPRKDINKKSKKINDVEMTTVDYESTLLVSAKVEDPGIEPAADVTSGKKKKKREKKVSKGDNLEMTMVDDERTSLGNNTTEECECQESLANICQETPSEKSISESLVSSDTVVCPDSTLTSNNKSKKKKSRTQNSDMDHENQNGATLENTTVERDVHSGYPIDTEGTTSEKPTPSADLSCSNKKKRKKKKEKVPEKGDDAYESHDKVGVSLEDTVMGNVVIKKIACSQPLEKSTGAKPEADQLYAESSLSLVNCHDTETGICDMDYGRHQNIGTQRQVVADANELNNNMNLATEVIGLNLATMKENYPTVEVEGAVSNGVSNSSINKRHKDTEAGNDTASEKTTTYKKRKKSSDFLEVRKSSDSGDTRRVLDDDFGNSLSQKFAESTTSSLLKKKFEASSEVDGVSEKAVHPLAEKVSANLPDPLLDVNNNEGNLSQVPDTLPERTLVSRSRKKLLILDVNGLLLDFVNYNPRDYKADITISKKYVFKRPYCDEFLQFCFENFTVAVWSSRMKWNMEKAIDFLFKDTQTKLLFCWDQSHCTMTGCNTIDNQSKPLVLKELRKVWDKIEPNLLYEKGEYDESNTLLLDDSPYKALRNPAHTAIFPKSYSYTDRDDNSLGPGGALRTYLEGLLLADNIQTYVQQNPFGQPAISESHSSWGFYRKIIMNDRGAASSRL